MFLDMVFEPVPNEVMAFGVSLENSDYGDGALSLRAVLMRGWCTNLAMMEETLRKVHLGARLREDLQLSQRTYELDSETMASAVRDLVQKVLNPGSVNEYLSLIKQANDQKLDGWNVKDFLRKNLTKGEGEAVIEKFNSADVELLPPGNTKWRMSNAISWLAGQTKDEHRQLEISKVAGLVIKGKPEQPQSEEVLVAA
jgi:hypothetical protein